MSDQIIYFTHNRCYVYKQNHVTRVAQLCYEYFPAPDNATQRNNLHRFPFTQRTR